MAVGSKDREVAERGKPSAERRQGGNVARPRPGMADFLAGESKSFVSDLLPYLPQELIGGIGIQRAPPESDESKRNARRFFLPTSFMPARLLTGLRAKTVESARNDPEPMLLRVQAPAILPNEVRAQLQGCLIVAHGYGSLASERIEARLVSLSCMDLDGKSVIETPLTGILVDSDGVKGLAGRPVSKMGANMARLLAAGLAQGAGASFQAAAQTTSISPLGQTTTIDPAQIARAGTGQGIANATQELTRIYADLVRQSSPVVEVGPSKEVTVVVTEGAWIDVHGMPERVSSAAP